MVRWIAKVLTATQPSKPSSKTFRTLYGTEVLKMVASQTQINLMGPKLSCYKEMRRKRERRKRKNEKILSLEKK